MGRGRGFLLKRWLRSWGVAHWIDEALAANDGRLGSIPSRTRPSGRPVFIKRFADVARDGLKVLWDEMDEEQRRV
jgi:hypothetical protein